MHGRPIVYHSLIVAEIDAACMNKNTHVKKYAHNVNCQHRNDNKAY